VFVDVRHADKVRGQGAGSVLTAAQIETVVRTALQLYLTSHGDRDRDAAMQVSAAPCACATTSARQMHYMFVTMQL